MSTTTRGTTISPADSFVPRHVGPSEAEVAEMLAVIGYASLDELIDATIPAAIRFRRPLAIHGGRSEHEALAAMRADRVEEPGLPLVPRAGLPRHAHAAGHPAEHPRESGLVHGVHAVSGRDRAGAARSAAELPDDGHRPDRAGDRQRVAARRSHGGGRGDVPWRIGARAGREATRSSSPSDCHPQTIDVVQTRARGARHEGRGRRLRETFEFGAEVFGVLRAVSRRPTARCYDYRELCRAGARGGRAGDRRGGPAGAHAAHAAGRVGRRRRASATRSASACRSATADRTRRSSPRGRVQAHDAGPHHRRVARRGRASRRCAWRCRRASSTSAARRRRATSARRRCCSR